VGVKKKLGGENTGLVRGNKGMAPVVEKNGKGKKGGGNFWGGQVYEGPNQKGCTADLPERRKGFTKFYNIQEWGAGLYHWGILSLEEGRTLTMGKNRVVRQTSCDCNRVDWQNVKKKKKKKKKKWKKKDRGSSCKIGQKRGERLKSKVEEKGAGINRGVPEGRGFWG